MAPEVIDVDSDIVLNDLTKIDDVILDVDSKDGLFPVVVLRGALKRKNQEVVAPKKTKPPKKVKVKREPEVVSLVSSDDERPPHIPRASSARVKVEDMKPDILPTPTPPPAVPTVEDEEELYESLYFDSYSIDFPTTASSSSTAVTSSTPSSSSHSTNTNYITPTIGQTRLYTAHDFTSAELPHYALPDSDPFTQMFLRAYDTHRKIQSRYSSDYVRVRSVVPRAAGTFMKIQQYGTKVLACTATSGGDADDSDLLEAADDYNSEGTLVELCGERRRVVDAHSSLRYLTDDPERDYRVDGNEYLKHYTINDVAYTPDAECFVTCGEDRKLSLWKSSSPDEENEDPRFMNRAMATSVYDGVPSNLSFNPSAPHLLAVSETHIQLHLVTPYHPHPLAHQKTLVVDTHRNRQAGDFVWGCGPMEGLLFASSEGETGGRHCYFDVEGRERGVFSANKETGDTLGLSNSGSLLALVTGDAKANHTLQIYDIRQSSAHATSSIPLLPYSFPRGAKERGEETSCAVWSPDDIYIALGRSDNRTCVYDVRMLDDVVGDFKHEDKKSYYAGMSYGIVRAEWVGSSRQLVTGGNDGYVRIWDPLLDSSDLQHQFLSRGRRGPDRRREGQEREQGQVVAEVPFSIASFHIGDRHKGEHELVVGDAGGTLHLYNGRRIPLFQ